MTTQSMIPSNWAARLRWLVSDAVVMVGRNVRLIPRTPSKLAASTVGPLTLLLLFTMVFGSAIEVPGGGNYAEFLVPGIFVQLLTWNIMNTAVGLSNDMKLGMVDRFRSLPMSRSAMLLGRAGGNLAESMIQLSVMSLCGLLVGWRLRGSVGDTVAAFGILLLWAFTMNWVGSLFGILVRDAEAIPPIAMSIMFPVTFIANTFVATGDMPAAIRAIADYNPISAVVAATRTLFGNPNPPAHGALPLEHPIAAALIWITVLTGVSWFLAVRRYRSQVSR
ncbi:MAG: ABC transporter permease [Labedaea sp.]